MFSNPTRIAITASRLTAQRTLGTTIAAMSPGDIEIKGHYVPTPPSEHIPDEAKEQEPDAEERAKELEKQGLEPLPTET
ncbi:hypothetical protein JCM24511_07780 [Saitozyma sp. JCM 24511]|nr:hypothetical protein JCM24511_07780 [Saitozyma sp. JCM 24511]